MFLADRRRDKKFVSSSEAAVIFEPLQESAPDWPMAENAFSHHAERQGSFFFFFSSSKVHGHGTAVISGSCSSAAVWGIYQLIGMREGKVHCGAPADAVCW